MLRKTISYILVILICLAFSGCSANPQDETLPVFTAPVEETQFLHSSGQRLLISAEADPDSVFVTIPQEQLGGNFCNDITYHQLSNVSIDIGGTSVKLEDAIRDGLITAEEITAYARIDARNGICKETYSSNNGLSRFAYTYSDFEVEIVHDIYETPDGQQHLIQQIGFYPPNISRNFSHSYIDDTSPYGYSIAREDWGIEFEITEVTGSGLVLAYTQSGGQQIGQLSLQNYIILSEDGTLPKLDSADDTPILERPPVSELQMNAQGEIEFDWQATYGNLPSGEYTLHLYVYDIYDESQVHPLMRNFTDNQRYTLTFSVE